MTTDLLEYKDLPEENLAVDIGVSSLNYALVHTHLNSNILTNLSLKTEG